VPKIQDQRLEGWCVHNAFLILGGKEVNVMRMDRGVPHYSALSINRPNPFRGYTDSVIECENITEPNCIIVC